MSSWSRRDVAAVLAGNLPALLLFLAFGLFPAVYSLYLSMTDWFLGVESFAWSGMENYRRMLEDAEFARSLMRSGIFAAGTVSCSLLTGIISAGLIDACSRRVSRWFGPLFVIPSVVSYVVIAAVWTHLYDPHFGLVNEWLRAVGVSGPAWLRDPSWAMAAIVVTSVWRETGFNLLVFLAGVRRIPDEVIESAAIDGAGAAQTWLRVRLPLLKPSIAFVTVVQTIRSAEAFGPFYIMTGGGPAKATTTAVFYFYQQAFESLQIGYGAALAWAIAACLFIVGMGEYWALRGGSGTD